MSRPVVLVDMDGPLADFDRQFFALCADRRWTLDCTPDTQTEYFLTRHMPDPAERQRARDVVNTTGWFCELPVVPGAIAGMEALAEHSDVWICTKPLEANPTCRDDKAEWLARHFGEQWVPRLIIAPDKSMIHGDLLLDDRPKIEWLGRASWRPVIYPTAWNGTGSDYADFPHWSWVDAVGPLLYLAQRKWAA